MKRVLSIVLVLVLVMMAFVACKKTEEPSETGSPSDTSTASPGESNPYTSDWEIANVYSEITGDFWGIVYNGCIAALEELSAYGIKGYCLAPANSADYTLQMDLIDAAVLKGVDGIILSPVNADAIGTYVSDHFTEQKGTPIIVIDRSLDSDSKWIVSSVMADAYKMGEECGKIAVEVMEGEGKYLCIGISQDNQNWADRSVGAVDYIEANSDMEPAGQGIYWTLVTSEDMAMQYIQDMMTNNPNDKIVFITSCEAYTNLTIAALDQLSDTVRARAEVVGFDFSNVSYQYILNDAICAAVGQNPYLMGYNAMFTMLDYLEGATLEKMVEVPYCIVTKDNLDTDEVKEYIASMGLTV